MFLQTTSPLLYSDTSREQMGWQDMIIMQLCQRSGRAADDQLRGALHFEAS